MSSLKDIFVLNEGVKTKRISSYDRSGGNVDNIPIPAGERKVIAEINGPGIIKHIWMTVACSDPVLRRNAVIRMYWDDSPNPSVEAPLGDFFGQGWGEHYLLVSLPLAGAPVNGSSMNCYFPMPFHKNAKIEIENQSDKNIDALYYYVDYEEHVKLPENAGYFHAWWNHELTKPSGLPEDRENEHGFLQHVPLPNQTDKYNYLIADIEGKGRFIGVNYYIDAPTPIWYGEGDDMWMIDGEDWPGSLHGTGTEDFFNTSWCPNEVYMHPYFGCAKAPTRFDFMGRTHYYRFLLEDSVYFEKSLRFSIEHGHCNVLTLDLASVAYWYQDKPHKAFKPMEPKEARQGRNPIGAREVHIWRDSWRREMRSKGHDGILWGDENLT